MGNNSQINSTSYYMLPSGKFLEDFIYYKSLNFNMGSALKYMWRAGYKDGEPGHKDMAKAEHYFAFEAKCRGGEWTSDKIREEVENLREEAYRWGFEDEYYADCCDK